MRCSFRIEKSSVFRQVCKTLLWSRTARHAINCLPDERMKYFSDGNVYRNLVYFLYGGVQSSIYHRVNKILTWSRIARHAMNCLPVDEMDYFLAGNVCHVLVYLIYGAEHVFFILIKSGDFLNRCCIRWC